MGDTTTDLWGALTTSPWSPFSAAPSPLLERGWAYLYDSWGDLLGSPAFAPALGFGYYFACCLVFMVLDYYTYRYQAWAEEQASTNNKEKKKAAATKKINDDKDLDSAAVGLRQRSTEKQNNTKAVSLLKKEQLEIYKQSHMQLPEEELAQVALILEKNPIARYKLQWKKKVTWPLIYRALALTMWNQLICVMPLVFMGIYFGSKYGVLVEGADEEEMARLGNRVYLPREAPHSLVVDVGLKLVFCMLLFDMLYWAWHWTFHKVPYLYRTVHSVHHRYSSPFSWVTQYVHPVELLFTGFFSFLTPILVGCHPLTSWLWIPISIYISIEAHSGYNFPWMLNNWIPFYGGAVTHDLHHQKPKTNYEPFFTYLDRFFNTDCKIVPSSSSSFTSAVKKEVEATSSSFNPVM
ncbi:Cholesterol 25-hydroxylase-like protein [Balamuthia mandrillaris]